MAAPIAAASPVAAAVNRSGRSGPRLSSAWRRTLRAGLRNLPAVASLACFVVVSSLLIIINKEVLVDDGFRFPFALTSMGQFVSALSAIPFAASGVASIKPPPSRRELLGKVLPTALFSAVTMFTGNYAYLYLSVAFIQILKAFTPAMTMVMLVAMGIEGWSGLVVLSVLMIAAGTGLSALIESSTPSFHLVGFIAFMISAVTEAGRVVWFQVALGDLKYNVFETMLYLSPITGAILGAMSLLTEWDGLTAPGGGFAKIWASPGLYSAALGMSCLVNLTTFIAIRQSSSLTFKVVGCVKNAVIVMAGVLFMGEAVSLWQVVGYSLSLAGFFVYSAAKMNAAPAKSDDDAKEK